LPFLKWYENLSVKVQEIDDQHNTLIEMINMLFDAMGIGADEAVLEPLIERMEAFAEVHFATEEKYFKAFGFAQAEAHIAEHLFFKEKVLEFKKKRHEQSMTLSVEILRFLNKWLVTHFQKEDQKYVDLFIANGLK